MRFTLIHQSISITLKVVGKKNMLDRLDGAFLVLIWAAYMAYLIMNL